MIVIKNIVHSWRSKREYGGIDLEISLINKFGRRTGSSQVPKSGTVLAIVESSFRWMISVKLHVHVYIEDYNSWGLNFTCLRMTKNTIMIWLKTQSRILADHQYELWRWLWTRASSKRWVWAEVMTVARVIKTLGWSVGPDCGLGDVGLERGPRRWFGMGSLVMTPTWWIAATSQRKHNTKALQDNRIFCLYVVIACYEQYIPDEGNSAEHWWDKSACNNLVSYWAEPPNKPKLHDKKAANKRPRHNRYRDRKQHIEAMAYL